MEEGLKPGARQARAAVAATRKLLRQADEKRGQDGLRHLATWWTHADGRAGGRAAGEWGPGEVQAGSGRAQRTEKWAEAGRGAWLGGPRAGRGRTAGQWQRDPGEAAGRRWEGCGAALPTAVAVLAERGRAVLAGAAAVGRAW